MKNAIPFSLPKNATSAKEVLARLSEICELLNMEKEEQAIEPAFFTGNLPDYPSWFLDGFSNAEMCAKLEDFCHYEPGDLDDYDMETWYDDMFACPSHSFSVQADDDNDQVLVFEVDDRDYGSDAPNAWLLVVAGAESLGVLKKLD